MTSECRKRPASSGMTHHHLAAWLLLTAALVLAHAAPASHADS